MFLKLPLLSPAPVLLYTKIIGAAPTERVVVLKTFFAVNGSFLPEKTNCTGVAVDPQVPKIEQPTFVLPPGQLALAVPYPKPFRLAALYARSARFVANLASSGRMSVIAAVKATWTAAWIVAGKEASSAWV